MVEMKTASMPAGKPNDATDQHPTSDLSDRLRDMTRRKSNEKEEDDDIAQTLVAVQVLLNQAEPLKVQSRGFGVVNREPTELRTLQSMAGLVSGKSDETTSRSIPTAAFEKYPAASYLQMKHGVHLSTSGTLAALRAAVTGPAPAIATSSLSRVTEDRLKQETVSRSALAQKDRKSAIEDVDQARLEPAEKLSRDRAAAKAPIQQQSARTTGARSVGAMPLNNLHQSESDNGWIYNFRSWGKQHAVRIAPATTMVQQSLPLHSAVSLQPFSTLVEQRLQDLANLGHDGDRWVLKERGDQQRQQQNAHQQRDDGNEDET